MQEKRKTINGEDIIYAMSSLGFDNYSETMKVYIEKFRESRVSAELRPFIITETQISQTARVTKEDGGTTDTAASAADATTTHSTYGSQSNDESGYGWDALYDRGWARRVGLVTSRAVGVSRSTRSRLDSIPIFFLKEIVMYLLYFFGISKGKYNDFLSSL